MKKPTHTFFELGPVARELFIQSLVSNVVASNAIEGIKVDPAEVRASALRILAQYERGEEPFKQPPEDPTSAP